MIGVEGGVFGEVVTVDTVIRRMTATN